MSTTMLQSQTSWGPIYPISPTTEIKTKSSQPNIHNQGKATEPGIGKWKETLKEEKRIINTVILKKKHLFW